MHVCSLIIVFAIALIIIIIATKIIIYVATYRVHEYKCSVLE